MKKFYILFYPLFLMSHNLFSQISYDSIIKPREEFFISKQDSTIVKGLNKKNKSLQFLCNNYKLSSMFLSSVFRYSNENSKTVHYLKQWNTPIIIYFDNKIPKEVLKKFKLFYSQFDSIKNLKIAYTKDFDKANFLIKTSNAKITKHVDKIKFKSEEERINHYLYNSTYTILKDKNNKFYSAILKINTSEFNNNLILKKIKQLFYASMGNFAIYPRQNKKSLLSSNYINNSTISEDDLHFIKAFYQIIYEQKVNRTTFKKLRKLAQKNCRK